MKPLYYVIIAAVIIAVIAIIINNKKTSVGADAQIATTQQQIVNGDSSQVTSIINALLCIFKQEAQCSNKTKTLKIKRKRNLM